MVRKRQRAKDRSEKKNGDNKKIEAEPPSDSVSGEREAKYRKEGKESEGEKKLLVVGWEHRETGACRSGVGRGNQEGRGPRCSAHKGVPSSPVTMGFSAPFSGTSRGVSSNKRGPGRLTKSRRVETCTHTHTHTHVLGKPLQPFWRREAAPFLCIPPPILSPTNTYRRMGRQAGSRKKMGSVSRTVLETEAPSHSFNALRINFADTCLWGRHTGETLVPLENCGTAERGWLVKPSPDKKKKGGWETQKTQSQVAYLPPSAAVAPPISHKVCSFLCGPLAPLGKATQAHVVSGLGSDAWPPTEHKVSNKAKKVSWRQQQQSSWSPDGSRATGALSRDMSEVVSSAPRSSDAHPEGFEAPPTSQPGVGFGRSTLIRARQPGRCASRKKSVDFWLISFVHACSTSVVRPARDCLPL